MPSGQRGMEVGRGTRGRDECRKQQEAEMQAGMDVVSRDVGREPVGAGQGRIPEGRADFRSSLSDMAVSFVFFLLKLLPCAKPLELLR